LIFHVGILDGLYPLTNVLKNCINWFIEKYRFLMVKTRKGNFGQKMILPDL